MIEKRVTVILYGCDRNLWSGGPLQIRVSDLFAAGGPKVLSSGTAEELHHGASAPAAVRCGPAVRPHVLRPASSSRVADSPAAGFHPGRRHRSKATTSSCG